MAVIVKDGAVTSALNSAGDGSVAALAATETAAINMTRIKTQILFMLIILPCKKLDQAASITVHLKKRYVVSVSYLRNS